MSPKFIRHFAIIFNGNHVVFMKTTQTRFKFCTVCEKYLLQGLTNEDFSVSFFTLRFQKGLTKGTY